MIYDIIDRLKIPLILMTVLVVGLIAASKIPEYLEYEKCKDSPVIGISVENHRIYSAEDTIRPSDFTIREEHDNGMSTNIRGGEVTISRTNVEETGADTEVEVKYRKAGKEYTSSVIVRTKREEVTTFRIGEQNESDVRAVLYSNGELCFEGEGGVLEYKNGDYPWKNYEGAGDHPVKSISFESGVQPVSMDGWFSGMQTLVFVDTVPPSVESMRQTFEGCSSLKSAPDMSRCTRLLDVERAFSDCYSLVTPPILPTSVTNAVQLCSDCIELQQTPDLTQCNALLDTTEMFAGCTKMRRVTLPPNVRIMNSMFRDCINLKNMPEIPESVTDMAYSFSGCVSMKKGTIIPRNVEKAESCFDGCLKLTGILWIDGNPSSYSNFLSDASVASRLDLQGNSKMLDVLALSGGDNVNITVNGHRPKTKDDDYEGYKYDDVYDRYTLGLNNGTQNDQQEENLVISSPDTDDWGDGEIIEEEIGGDNVVEGEFIFDEAQSEEMPEEASEAGGEVVEEEPEGTS